MTLEQIKTMLDGLGMPVAYGKINRKKVNPPYCVYRVASEPNKLNVDDSTLWKVQNIEVNVVTTKKDEATDENLETILTNKGIIFEVTFDNYDSAEKVYIRQTIFENNKFKGV